jgi:hypothetical protein
MLGYDQYILSKTKSKITTPSTTFMNVHMSIAIIYDPDDQQRRWRLASSPFHIYSSNDKVRLASWSVTTAFLST